MSHKSDEVLSCLSLVVFSSIGVHDLSVEITGMKEYHLITLLHISIKQAQISCEYTQAVQHLLISHTVCTLQLLNVNK